MPKVRPMEALQLGQPLVEQLLPEASIQTLEVDPRLTPRGEELPEAERRAIAQAIEKRQRQYTAGRMLARQLLKRRGVADFALVSDAQRVPQWPPGWRGCITHTDLWCAVALAPASDFLGLGIDVEPATDLSPSLWDSIARADELSWIAEQPASLRGLLCKGLFSAKESIYKALYPTVREFLGFESMRIDLQAHSASRYVWSATLQKTWGQYAPGHQFTGGQMIVERGLLATAIALPHTR